MKTTMKILSLLLVLVLSLSIFAGCGSVDDPNGGVSGGKTFVTITWMQGQRLLKEEVVEKGTLLTEWIPEGSGEFKGWYERPYIKKFDFTKPVTKSMIIYASFIGGDEGPIDVPTPDWYLIGAGKGDLKKCNNWKHEDAARNLGLTAGEDGIYRVTLTLYEGDQFKMTNDMGWDNEKAIDKMAGFADGSVKDADGNVVFTAGENNNFVVAEGMSGKYEISYDADADVMDFKFIEALESLPDDIRLIGDNNGWSENYSEDDYKFTTTDNVTWTYVWEVTSAVKFKVFNFASLVYYPGGVGNDLHIDEAGTYTITLNVKTREVVVTDANGNKVDVGFTAGGNEGGDNSGESTDNPYVPTTDTTIYFVPNATWLADGARFAVYYWSTSNTSDNNWVDLIAGDNGIYSATVPAGYGNVIFCRMDGEATENTWDAKWNQTENLYILESGENYFVMYEDAKDKTDGNATGAWGINATVPTRPSQGGGNPSESNGPALTESVTVYFENNWLWTNVSCHYWGGEGFVGTEMPGAPMTKVGTLNGHDVYSIELPVGVTGFMFTGNKDKEPYDLDKSPDIPTSAISGVNAWKMDWADGNLVTGFTYDPNATEEPTETDAYYLAGYLNDADYEGTNYKFVDGKLTVKFNAGSNHYVYITTGAGQKLMTPAYVSGSKGTFVANGGEKMLVPGGVDVVFTLVVNEDGSVTVSYEVVDLTEHTYTIAGSSAEFLGTAWAPELAANGLVYDSTTGLFTKSFTNNTGADIEFSFKVVTDHSWNNPNYGASNVVDNGVEVTTNNDGNAIVIVPAGKTLTVAFNSQNKNIILTIE